MATISGSLIRRTYNNFRGLDTREGEISYYRSPDALNLWKNYKSSNVLETRPSLELSTPFDDTIHGLFFYEVGNRVIQITHAGTKLYANNTEIYNGMTTLNTQFFVYNNILYILDGTKYLQYDGQTCTPVQGYIPTTSIGRKPNGGGSMNEDVNMLSNYRKNTFCADGVSTEYYVDAETIDGILMVKVNDQVVTNYTSQNTKPAHVTFTTAPTKPLTDGQDNVEITYIRNANQRERIEKCTKIAVFDNRVFYSGNPNYPNVLWHCSLNDPTYISDLDYYNEGLDLSPIKDLIPGNNALWVLKAPSQANTTIFYHNPVIDGTYGKIYPSTHSSITTGCIGAGRNFNDAIVFFSDRGMEGITGDITTEQVISHRSSYIDSKLLKETNYEHMILEEFEGYLMVFIDNKVYLADSRKITEENGNFEFDWYYWELPYTVTTTCVYKGILYLGTTNGVYTLNGINDVYSYWTTLKDKFNYGNYQKITNKKGCIVECEGELINVLVKSNKEETFGLIKTYENVTDYLIARIKRKKFKDMQIKIESNKKMKLESIMIESYIGAYIKR